MMRSLRAGVSVSTHDSSSPTNRPPAGKNRRSLASAIEARSLPILGTKDLLLATAGVLLSFLPALAQSMWLPTPAAPIHWQWQLGAAFKLSTDIVPNVTVYDLDAFDTPESVVSALHARGCVVIGYFSMGTWENWRPDASKFPASVKGRSNGWAGEKWLDIRNLTVLGPIMQSRLDLAKSKGFDAIEPDNVDGYTNSTGFSLTAQHQLSYNKWIANQCHLRGLSVGLKNDVDQLVALQPYFDWALNEESFKYSEYSGYSAFINNNKAVFEVEYTKTTSQAKVMNAMHINSMTRDLNLRSPRSTGYRRLPCIPDTQNSWTTVASAVALTSTASSSAPPLNGWYAWNDATACHYTFSYGNYSWDSLRTFIDVDTNPATGCSVGGIGAEYKIEDGQLFRWIGAWSSVKPIAQTKGSGVVEWVVARSDIEKNMFPASADMLFQAAMASGLSLTSLKYTHVFSSSAEPIVNYYAWNDSTNVHYTATFTQSFDKHRIYIDADCRQTTGFPMEQIGADFKIEEDSLYKFEEETSSWSLVGPVRQTIDGQTYSWRLNRSLVIGASQAPLTNGLVFEGTSALSGYVTSSYQHCYSY